MSIESRVLDILTEQLGIDAEDIVPSSHLTNDLGADSLDHVELMMALEEEFNLDIPDSDADALKTFADLMAYVNKSVARKPYR